MGFSPIHHQGIISPPGRDFPGSRGVGGKRGFMPRLLNVAMSLAEGRGGERLSGHSPEFLEFGGEGFACDTEAPCSLALVAPRGFKRAQDGRFFNLL